MTNDDRLELTLRAELARVTRQRDAIARAVRAHRTVCMAETSDEDIQHEADLALWHAVSRVVGDPGRAV